MTQYRLEDLIDIVQFQELQDRLNAVYSFPSAIIDNDGNILTATAWQDICTKFHRQNPVCEHDCRISDQYILDHLAEAAPAVSYRCPRGLVDNATPIIIDGVHYGNFFTGQFFLEPPDLGVFRSQARAFGFDEEKYLEAVRKVPVWSQEQLNNYLFFIKGLIEVISTSGLKKLKEIEARKSIEENEESSRAILAQMSDGFWKVDRVHGKILDVNLAMCRMLGYAREELLELSVADIEALDGSAEIERRIKQIIQDGSAQFESRFRRKDGKEIDVEVAVSYIQSEDKLFGFHRDISERKQAETSLRRLNRELRAISEFNQALVRADDEQTLLEDICRIVCDEAGYRMAWVGYTEQDENQSVRPAAWAGHEDGYLSSIHVSWGESETGRGAVGLAIRSGRPVYVQDMANDPRTRVWRDKALERGYLSCIALPLKDEAGNSFGVLGIFSGAADAFWPDEIRLLEELAGDLAFGITGLRTRKKREQTEALLQKSEERFRQLFEGHNAVMLLLDANTGDIVDGNPAATKFYGYTRSQLQAMNVAQINCFTSEEIAAEIAKAREGEKSYFIFPHRLANGELRTVEIRSTPLDTSERRLLFSIVHDITERVRGEKIIRNRVELMEYASTHAVDQILVRTLDQVGELTGSPIGFYHFVSDDQASLSLQAWSTRTAQEFCQISQAGAHYAVDQAGVWADSLREKKPLIHNDYASLAHRKGLPEGHAALVRELVVPILREDKVVALFGVGNKTSDYDRNDVDLAAYYADLAWEVVVRKKTEEEIALRLSFEKLVTDIQARLFSVDSEDLDAALLEAQRQICGLLGVERSAIWLWSGAEQAELRLQLQFTPSGIPTLPGPVLANEFFPWLTGRALADQTTILPDIQSLPLEAGADRENLQKFGVRSLLSIPFAVGNSGVSGSVTFSTITKLFQWSDIIVNSCRMVTQAFASSLARRQADQLLRANEGKFRALVENSFDGMILMSAERRPIYVSPSYTRVTGHQPQELIGIYGPDFIHPDDREATANATRTILQQPGKSVTVEYRLRHKDGHYIWVETIATNMLEDPNVQAIVLNSRNISDRKQHEKELSAIVAISAALRTAPTREDIFGVLIQQLIQLISCDAITIETIDEDSGEVVTQAAHGLWAGLQGTSQATAMGFNALIAETHQPYYSANLDLDSHGAYPPEAREGIHSTMGVPLIAQQKLIGFLWCGSAHSMIETDMRLLLAVGDIAANAIQRAILHEKTRKSAIELAVAYEATLEGWAHALELRDQETEGHARRVVERTVYLALCLGVPGEDLIDIRRGALLHDIGKMGVPDTILLKPGTLNEREWETMRRHPEFAKAMLRRIEFLRSALDIPYCHHEKWDGSGYPQGLKGEEIPLAARIFAVVDVWDALTTNRPYRSAWSFEQAKAYMLEQSGKHFDPHVLDVFLTSVLKEEE